MKNVLKFFKYYWKFVSQYTYIAQSLVDFKIKDFKEISLKNKNKNHHINNILLQKLCSDLITYIVCKCTMCKVTFKKLKSLLCVTLILVFSDFNYFFKLYVDDSKKWEFKTALHQINQSEFLMKCFIFYILKMFSSIKQLYWSTKLKTTALI